ncbi:MAG TPA: catalase family peroxidase [Burkholderiaceae bacterium]|jgi:catalase|nr:catalase family peroxidase [Burkholderiaceae bacterium]
MPEHRNPSAGLPIAPLALIAAIVCAIAAAFAYTAGWLTPSRLTPPALVDTLAPASGPVLGFRRNHAKGVCFTGSFEANGQGVALSKAPMFAAGSYPVTGRFNLATPDPHADDAMARVRGLGLRIFGPGRQEWRAAMIDAPFFPVATPQAFYELQKAGAAKDDPDAMKHFAAAHPEIGAFGAWAGSAPFTASYAEERYNSLDSFVFVDAAGGSRTVRWSFVPVASPVPVTAEALKAHGGDFLARELADRVRAQAVQFKLLVTASVPGDPTADPSKAWPAERPAVDVGTLDVKTIEAEADGPCRDINFDPTVLPAGMAVSDDPFPAARSAAYAVSFDRRTAETKDYPRHPAAAQP